MKQLKNDLKPFFRGAGAAFALPHTDYDDVFGNRVLYRHDRLWIMKSWGPEHYSHVDSNGHRCHRQ